MGDQLPTGRGGGEGGRVTRGREAVKHAGDADMRGRDLHREHAHDVAVVVLIVRRVARRSGHSCTREQMYAHVCLHAHIKYARIRMRVYRMYIYMSYICIKQISGTSGLHQATSDI